jgi:hypothetical protein
VPPTPWWRHGSVWLLLSGPSAVVVASMVTAFIAARGADTLVDDNAWRKGQELQHAAQRAQLPAMTARNHAATPAPAEH